MSNRVVPKLIGFELELANFLVGLTCSANASRAAQAIVDAHHHLFGCRRDEPGCLANEFDGAGFRIYRDHEHAELGSPLAASARDLVFITRVGLHMIQHCVRRAEECLGHPIRVGVETCSRRGVSWGFHVSVLLAREAFDAWRDKEWAPLMPQWVPFLVTSPGLLGGGKMRGEAGGAPCLYQMSQRSDFVNRLVGLETVDSKSCINTRDEPLADPARYARFHIISLDSNRCEFANFLKFGTCQLLLSLVEEGYPLPELRLADPLAAFAASSRDLRFNTPLQLSDGRRMTALEVQYSLAESVADAVAKGSAATEVPDAQHIVALWLRTLQDLADGAPILAKRLDWRVRLELIRRARIAAPDRPWVAESADVDYGTLGGPFDGLARGGAVERLEDFLPPREGFEEPMIPRELARGLFVERFGEQVLEANWHYLIVQDASGAPWEIVMDDPVNSGGLLRVALSTSDRASCLEGLIHAGFATQCASLDGLLVVSGPQSKEDKPDE